MSDETANANATETKAGDKSVSALGGAAPDTSKNGATGTEQPASKDAQAAVKGAGTEGAAGDKQTEAFDFTKWEPTLAKGEALPKETVEAFRGLGKDLGLKGEGAQKLVDAWSAAKKADVAATLKSVEDNRVKSFEKLRGDKDIGGANLDESMKHARRAVREFGGQELADRLFDLGLDNDDVFVRAFIKAGKRLGEDSVGDTAHKAGTEKADTFEDRVTRTYSKSSKEKES